MHAKAITPFRPDKVKITTNLRFIWVVTSLAFLIANTVYHDRLISRSDPNLFRTDQEEIGRIRAIMLRHLFPLLLLRWSAAEAEPEPGDDFLQLDDDQLSWSVCKYKNRLPVISQQYP